MSKTALILFAACVGLSLLSLHLVKQTRDGQATIAELQAQVAALERQQQNPEPLPEPDPVPFSAFQVEPAPVAPEPQPAPAPKAPPKAASAGSGFAAADGNGRGMPSREERMRMMREARERQRQLMQDPEYREAMRIQHRSGMSRQYPGVAEDLDLTPEQTEQLFNLLADQQMRSNEQIEPMWDSENLDPAAMQQRAEKMRQQWAETQRKNEAELAAHLGQDKIQGWKEYQSTLGARHQAEQLRTSLASQGVPLSDDANRAVIKALADAQKAEQQEYANQARVAGVSQVGTVGAVAMLGSGVPRAGGPTAEVYERQLESAKKRNQRVLDALSPYLTYEQIEAVRKQHEAQIKMQEAHYRIMRAQENANQGNANSVGVVSEGWVPLQ